MTPQVVLVIDDEPEVRRVLASLLHKNGFQPVTAGDGAEGLETFRDIQPDLVLSDIRMPRLDGIEVCRRLKSNTESRLTPVILITGGGSDEKLEGIEAGADDFLSKPIDEVELLARVRSLMRLKSYTDELERAEAVLFSMARTIEERDPYTRGHCERLSAYSSLLGMRLGLPEEEVNALRQGGVVHDLGKISVPDSILLKDGPLTPSERTVIECHPVTGERICSSLKSFALIRPIIRHHHEKIDGTGYPDGLRGEEIPLTARILQVVDVFDALTTERSYRRAMPVETALKELAQEVRRGWWDPDIFEAFRTFALDEIPSVVPSMRPLPSVTEVSEPIEGRKPAAT